MPNLDLTNLTNEQKTLIEEFLYSKSKYSELNDTTGFVIPFIAMNDGHTPAQIRSQPKGLYKDIQRSPFLRKSGTFSKDNSIIDIDISPLIYYGTLEQSKIAPTLENIDVKLYYREPTIKKIPDNVNNTDPESYADTYIWRELPIGFHTYNNDTVYGYEWVVLQDDYVSSDGVYNLHMNIEDGLGCCKFAGTQAPIGLYGVQYKVIITAKNLWNREYSLIDTTPVLHSLDGSSDELAPSVDAIKKYYAAALKTLKVVTDTLFVGDSEDPIVSITKDKVTIKQLNLGEIENLENYINNIKDDYTTHKTTYVDNTIFDENGNVVGVHGIINKGFAGNIAAKTLDGLSISNGQQAIYEDINSKYAYIPYVDINSEVGFGTTVNYYSRSGDSDPSPIYRTSFKKQNNTLLISNTSRQSEVTDLLESISVGSTILNSRISTIDNVVTLSLTAGSTEKEIVNLKTNKLTVASIAFDNSDLIINASRVAYWNGASSIAYKNPISELIGFKLKEINDGEYTILSPNVKKDVDGIPATDLDTKTLENDLLVASKDDIKAFDKLGSALQALHELPLGTYEYKRGQNEYKEQLGIFVERVNQIRDHLGDIVGDGEVESKPAKNNYLVYKKNTLLKSSNNNIIDATLGAGEVNSNKVEDNAYTYTDEEIKSIAHYLDLTTSKKELAQEIRNTVGILLKAAKETQDRLLDVETAVYGFDAKNLPGSNEAKQAFINKHIDKELQDQINNNPFLLGLNRLMRALLLEIFDTTELEDIDAEIESKLTDSDSLSDKVTIKSRMDKIDEIVQESYNQTSAVVRYYIENIMYDEGQHTYTDIVDVNEAQKITTSLSVEEDNTLLNNLEDDHTETRDRDKGRSWKTLPTKADVTKDVKDTVGFAEIATSVNKHTPNVEETGIVRVPEIQIENHEDSDATGKVTNRSWDLFKLDKDTKTNTYKPVFRTKAVAWDSAKLERINTKLSEVTKTIYGVDDVTASLPNRTEVLRRNITNLIDDLYPNRSFKIERNYTELNEPSAEIKLPFKTSKEQNPEENNIAENVVDEKLNVEHTSIIKYFDDELFNFNIRNNYFGEYSELKEDATIKFKSNKQITLDPETAIIDFNSSKLVSDVNVFDPENYGTYNKAYSRLGMLENIIGIEDCYISDLYSTNILDAFEIGTKYTTTVNLNPKAKNWYEKVNNNTILTLDTTPVLGKKYYIRVGETSTYSEVNIDKYRDTSYHLDLAACGEASTEQDIINLRGNINNQQALINGLNKSLDDEKAQKTALEAYKVKLSNKEKDLQKEKDQITTDLDLCLEKKTTLESNKDIANQNLAEYLESINSEDFTKAVTDIQNILDFYTKIDNIISNNTVEKAIAFNTFDLVFQKRASVKDTLQYQFIKNSNSNSKVTLSEVNTNIQDIDQLEVQFNKIIDNLFNNFIKNTLTFKNDQSEIIISAEKPNLATKAVSFVNNINYCINSKELKLSSLNNAAIKVYTDNENLISSKQNLQDQLNIDIKYLELDIEATENSIENSTNTINDLSTRIEAAKKLLSDYQIDLNTKLIYTDLLTESSSTYNVIKSYRKELEFENFVNQLNITTSPSFDDTLSVSLITASNLGFVLSRKVKTLQSRVTSVEAFADELAKGFNYISLITTSRDTPSQTLLANKRYEATDVYSTLQKIGQYISNLQAKVEPIIFDIDLTESYTGTFEHNVTLWQVVMFSSNVKKTSLSLNSTTDASYLSSYKISGTMTIDAKLLLSASEDTHYIFNSYQTVGQDWTITVKYIKAGVKISKPDTHTIYLVGKVPTTDYAAFYNTNTTAYLNGSSGYQNQTEYNIYKTMNNLFSSLLNNGKKGSLAATSNSNNLYYQLMLLAHPIGSIYEAMKVEGADLTTPDKLFGGDWKELKDGYLLPSANPDNATVTPKAAVKLETKEINAISNTTTTAAQNDKNTNNIDTVKETVVVQDILETDNIKNIKIKAWVRIA